MESAATTATAVVATVGVVSSSSTGRSDNKSSRNALLGAIACGVGVYYLWKLFERWNPFSDEADDDFPLSEAGTLMSRLDLPSPLLPEDQRRPNYMPDVVSDTTCSLAGTYASNRRGGVSYRHENYNGVARVRSHATLTGAMDNPLGGGNNQQNGSNNVSFASYSPHQYHSPPSVAPILILYGSESGTAKGYALGLARELRLRGSCEVEVIDPQNITYSNFGGWGAFVTRTESSNNNKGGAVASSPHVSSDATKNNKLNSSNAFFADSSFPASACASVSQPLHAKELPTFDRINDKQRDARRPSEVVDGGVESALATPSPLSPAHTRNASLALSNDFTERGRGESGGGVDNGCSSNNNKNSLALPSPAANASIASTVASTSYQFSAAMTPSPTNDTTPSSLPFPASPTASASSAAVSKNNKAAIESFCDGAFNKRAVIIFITATYGDGGPCGNYRQMYEALAAASSAADHSPTASSFLCETHVAVFGLGSTAYKKFCEVGKQTAEHLERLGARLITPLVCADSHSTAARPVDDVFDSWQEALVEGMERLDDQYRAENAAIAMRMQWRNSTVSMNGSMQQHQHQQQQHASPSLGQHSFVAADLLVRPILFVSRGSGGEGSSNAPLPPTAIAKLRFMDSKLCDTTVYPTPPSVTAPNAKRPLRCRVLEKRRLMSELMAATGGGGAEGRRETTATAASHQSPFTQSPRSVAVDGGLTSKPSPSFAGQDGGNTIATPPLLAQSAPTATPTRSLLAAASSANPSPRHAPSSVAAAVPTMPPTTMAATTTVASGFSVNPSLAASMGELLFMSFDISASTGLQYQAGDHLSIYGRNDPKTAAAVLEMILYRHLQLPAGEQDQHVAAWFADATADETPSNAKGGKKKAADNKDNKKDAASSTSANTNAAAPVTSKLLSSDGSGGGGGAIGEPAAASSTLFRNKHIKSPKYYFGTKEGRAEMAAKGVHLEAPTLNKARASGVSTFPMKLSLLHVFEWYLDLSGPPKKSLLRTMARCCRDPKERASFMASLKGGSAVSPQAAQLVASQSPTTPPQQRQVPQSPSPPIKRIYDYLLQYPSCVVPLDLFLEVCPRVAPRRYSIASDMLRTPNALHIVAKVVHNGLLTRYLDQDVSAGVSNKEGGGVPVGGGGAVGLQTAALHNNSNANPASSFSSVPPSQSTRNALLLNPHTSTSPTHEHSVTTSGCSLLGGGVPSSAPGVTHDYVYAFISPSDFHLPPPKQLKTRPMLMIGPGTGIAPLLGFAHRRLAIGLNGGKDKVPPAKRSGYSLEAAAEEVRASAARHAGSSSAFGASPSFSTSATPCALFVGCRDFSMDCAVRMLFERDPLMLRELGYTGAKMPEAAAAECKGDNANSTTSPAGNAPRKAPETRLSAIPPLTLPIRVAISRGAVPVVGADGTIIAAAQSPSPSPCQWLLSVDSIPNIWSFGKPHAAAAPSPQKSTTTMLNSSSVANGLNEAVHVTKGVASTPPFASANGADGNGGSDGALPSAFDFNKSSPFSLAPSFIGAHAEGPTPLRLPSSAPQHPAHSSTTSTPNRTAAPQHRLLSSYHYNSSALADAQRVGSCDALTADNVAAGGGGQSSSLVGGVDSIAALYGLDAGCEEGVGGGSFKDRLVAASPSSQSLRNRVSTDTLAWGMGGLGGGGRGVYDSFDSTTALVFGNSDGEKAAAAPINGNENNSTSNASRQQQQLTPSITGPPTSSAQKKTKNATATPPPNYVQSLIRQEARYILQTFLLNPDSFIYVCGDALRMARDVRGAFLEMLTMDSDSHDDEGEGEEGDGDEGLANLADRSTSYLPRMTRPAAEAHLAMMEKQGRYLQDIW